MDDTQYPITPCVNAKNENHFSTETTLSQKQYI